MTDNADMYSTVVLLMGEPASFGGLILLYIFAFLLTVFMGVLGLVVTLSVLRWIARR